MANGEEHRSWFNISKSLPITEDTINYDELKVSSNLIKNIIEEEARLLNNNYSHIFVGGFSQGCCLTFDIGLSFQHTLGGITCFCGTNS